MKDNLGESVKGFAVLWCERCRIKVSRPTYWKKYECPVCRAELVVHVERKEPPKGTEGGERG